MFSIIMKLEQLIGGTKALINAVYKSFFFDDLICFQMFCALQESYR